MRLFCRDNHDERDMPICPPHDFNSWGWDKDTDGRGVTWCSACGDMRYLTPPAIEEPAIESERAEVSK